MICVIQKFLSILWTFKVVNTFWDLGSKRVFLENWGHHKLLSRFTYTSQLGFSWKLKCPSSARHGSEPFQLGSAQLELITTIQLARLFVSHPNSRIYNILPETSKVIELDMTWHLVLGANQIPSWIKVQCVICVPGTYLGT